MLVSELASRHAKKRLTADDVDQEMSLFGGGACVGEMVLDVRVGITSETKARRGCSMRR